MNTYDHERSFRRGSMGEIVAAWLLMLVIFVGAATILAYGDTAPTNTAAGLHTPAAERPVTL